MAEPSLSQSSASFQVPSGSISPVRRRKTPTPQGATNFIPNKQDLPIYLTSFTVKLLLLTLVFLIVLGSAIFTYWFLYFRLIPKSELTFPAHLGPDHCMDVQLSPVQWKAHFEPLPHVEKPADHHANDATYDLSLALTLASSYTAQTFLESAVNSPSARLASSVRSFVPFDRSILAKYTKSLLFLWPEIFHFFADTQHVHISLFEKFPLIYNASSVSICFSPQPPLVHEATLRFTQRHLHWNLQYFVSEFPFTVFAIFLAAVIACFAAVAVAALLFANASPEESSSDRND